LYGDAVKIRQIILNLLGNSIKYTEKGHIGLYISAEPVETGKTNLMIEITDTGIGIKQEELDSVFEAFMQSDIQKNVGVEGTGLGLTITRSFVRAMNGKINVKSEYGSGSVFTVTIPQEVREYQALATVNDPGSKNVLIFERRKICQEAITRTMDDFNVKYEFVSSSAEFREKLADGVYTHVFLSSVLYTRVKNECGEIDSEATFILISEFGESVTHRDVSVLSMPVFCIPVAHFLNGESGSFIKDINAGIKTKFTAPQARILIVDDIKTNLTVAKGLLLPYEMQIDTCLNGSDAVEAVKAKKYDLVLMDHMMPGMDGIEATQRIRKLDATGEHYFKNLPIVALTANAVSGMKELFLSNGFDDFVSKPIDMLKLNSVLESRIPKEKQIRPDETSIRHIEEAPGQDELFNQINIEGLDKNKGLQMVGGAVKNYFEILNIFYNDLRKKIGELNLCLETGDISLFTIHVHALKNACAVVGAQKLSGEAQSLEMAGKRDDLSYINENGPIFVSALEKMTNDVNAVLSGNEPKNQPVISDIEIDELKNYLVALKLSLIEYDTSAIRELSSAFDETVYNNETTAVLLEIQEKRLIGEYDEAVSLIDDLLTGLGEGEGEKKE